METTQEKADNAHNKKMRDNYYDRANKKADNEASNAKRQLEASKQEGEAATKAGAAEGDKTKKHSDGQAKAQGLSAGRQQGGAAQTGAAASIRAGPDTETGVIGPSEYYSSTLCRRTVWNLVTLCSGFVAMDATHCLLVSRLLFSSKNAWPRTSFLSKVRSG
jgi:hypothetical protein